MDKATWDTLREGWVKEARDCRSFENDTSLLLMNACALGEPYKTVTLNWVNRGCKRTKTVAGARLLQLVALTAHLLREGVETEEEFRKLLEEHEQQVLQDAFDTLMRDRENDWGPFWRSTIPVRPGE